MKTFRVVVGFLTGILAAGCGAQIDAAGTEQASDQTTPENTLAPINGSPAATGTPVVVKPQDIEVARIDYPNGNSVGWYEPVPGFLTLGESFKYPNPPILREFEKTNGKLPQKASELYRALAPSAAIPQALIEAEGRVAYYAELSRLNGRPTSPKVEVQKMDVPGLDETTTRGPSHDGISEIQQALPDDSACPWSWFWPNYCSLCPDGQICGDWIVHWSYRTGTSSFQRNDTWWTRVAMCSYRGTERYLVGYQPWYSWSTVVDVTRNAGEGWYWGYSDTTYDFDVSSRVEQADGDGYHHCGAGQY